MKNAKYNRLIPVEKLSKKAYSEICKLKRGSWNGVNPATKVIQSSKKTKLEKIYRCEAASY